MDENKLVSVRNRNSGSTGFVLDNGVKVNFEYNETRKIPFKQLMELTYAPGGQYILDNYLVVEDEEALAALNMAVEPEYFYSENEIKKILLDTSDESLARLEDTLNFAPEGAIDLIKKIAIDIEVPDIRKRDLISKRTGFNINNSINLMHQLAEESGEEAKEEAPKRKVAPLTAESAAPQRKAETPAKKYNVVSK